MKYSFAEQHKALTALAFQKNPESNSHRHAILKDIANTSFPKTSIISQYFEILLYLLAYPTSKAEFSLVKKEIQRLARHINANKDEFNDWLQNTGLPTGTVTTQFSHDSVRWLLSHSDYKVAIDSFDEHNLQLSNAFNMTLPSIEKHIPAAGLGINELMDVLLVPKKERLKFIINEFSRFDAQPQVKDTLFDQLGLYVTVIAKGRGINKATNKLDTAHVFYHDTLMKQFDHEKLINSPLPSPQKLSKTQKEQAIQTVKNTMLLTARETDPTTYMQLESFRLYSLERGVSIAIYGMKASRQLPLESYVGYTVFKNGLPVSYGGSWVFGERANFGINVFEPFRKGESGYIMAQLLRVYKNVFGITYFEVEPHQYGLDNPEGIESGAFWFYYKYGFRPVVKAINALAKREAEKIKKKRGYRTSYKTLIEFTESNIGLQLGKKIPPSVPSITSKITRMIRQSYKGNRIFAESDCIASFKNDTGLKRINPAASYALSELALWAKAMNITHKPKLKIMAEMVKAKSKDMYAYQELLLKFLAKTR
jgi:hypothetical protein